LGAGYPEEFYRGIPLVLPEKIRVAASITYGCIFRNIFIVSFIDNPSMTLHCGIKNFSWNTTKCAKICVLTERNQNRLNGLIMTVKDMHPKSKVLKCFCRLRNKSKNYFYASFSPFVCVFIQAYEQHKFKKFKTLRGNKSCACVEWRHLIAETYFT
jgi:hypothetical protein